MAEEKKYALFLGCTIPLRLPHLEAASRRILESFGIGVADMPNAVCCPEPSLRSFDPEAWMALAARNLCIAQEMGLDILTLCNGCFETLKTVNNVMKSDENDRRKVNERLIPLNHKFEGTIDVVHFVEVLHRDVGLERIRQNVVKPLTGLRVASHYGCHLLRPSRIMKTDDPVRPTILDTLVDAIGATSIPYYKKNLCCGGTVGLADEATARDLVTYKLNNVKRAGADCMAVVCPNCMLQYDLVQTLVKRDDGKRFDIPVFYYAELLLIAMGMDTNGVGLSLHAVKPDSVLAKIGRR